jgi:hypothetical protein
MKILWTGIKITEQQYKKLKKIAKKDGTVKIGLPALEGAVFMDRKVKFSDLVYGGISRDDVRPIFVREMER